MAKIAYIAKHDSGDNDDEGSITHALRELGHTVQKIQESRVRRIPSGSIRADFVLFNHSKQLRDIKRASGDIPIVCWCFDAIHQEDPKLTLRTRERSRWATQVTEMCTLAFFTDGDWVEQDRTGKLHWLMQGADERVIGPGKNRNRYEILFAGAVGHGGLREAFLKKLKIKYGSSLHIQGTAKRVYRREYADLVCSTKINLAPLYPVTNTYWSNRVYVVSGFGGFLLHPRSSKLEEQYTDGEEIVYYNDERDLYDKIEYYLPREDERQRIATNALRRTERDHLYRHRCKTLVDTVLNTIK